jgi:hypothetical protein
VLPIGSGFARSRPTKFITPAGSIWPFADDPIAEGLRAHSLPAIVRHETVTLMKPERISTGLSIAAG